MDAATRTSALIIAAGVLIAGLFWMRDILAPFVIAVFLWLIMDSFASAITVATKGRAPRWLAILVAVAVVTAGAAATVAVITDSAGDFASRGGEYEARLEEVIAQGYALIGNADAPTVSELFVRIGPGELFQSIAGAVRGLASDAIFVFIYVGFLFAAQASFPKKMDILFPESEARARAAKAVGSARISIERYMGVQTFVSVLTTILSYITLRALGLDNALFWSFLIFLLNYIPTIGSIVATVLPTLFALVQFDTLWQPLAVFAGVGFWQFTIGNFIQPRMLGDSLNLSTIVVLLGLAIWGKIWGLTGVFLSAPLTVMVMIALAQFPSTRWIAVMLSADGRPDLDFTEPPPARQA